MEASNIFFLHALRGLECRNFWPLLHKQGAQLGGEGEGYIGGRERSYGSHIGFRGYSGYRGYRGYRGRITWLHGSQGLQGLQRLQGLQQLPRLQGLHPAKSLY